MRPVSHCKKCYAIYGSKWARDNSDKKRAACRRWKGSNPDKAKACSAKWAEENSNKVKEKNRKWREDNRDKCRANAYRWRERNPEKFRESMDKWYRNHPGRSAEYSRRRRSYDIDFKIINNIRHGLNKAIARNTKTGHTIELLGCSIEELRSHLERQFKSGMTWDNYPKWHIDHIIPLSYFDMSDPEQQKRAWHYTNLQPLWAKDNLHKNNKIEEKQLRLL